MTIRPYQPELAHLRTFLVVCRVGTIGQAAKYLRLSQPAISTHLKILEKGMKRKLLARSPRGVKPTPAGEILRNQIEQHLDGLESSMLASETVEGLVVLGGPADLLSMRAVPALKPLFDRKVKIKMKTGIAEDLLDRLAAEELDIVIATRWPNNKTELSFEPLFEEEHLLVGNKQWHDRVAAKDPEEAIRNLSRADFLAFDEQLPLIRDHPFIRKHYGRIFGNSPNKHVSLYATDLRALRNSAIVGAGITVIPRYMAAHALVTKQLFELFCPASPHRNTIYIATRRGAVHPRIQETVSTLKAAAPEWDKDSAVLISMTPRD